MSEEQRSTTPRGQAPVSTGPVSTGDEAPSAKLETASYIETVKVSAVATSGRREAFRNIFRQLSSEELSNPGVQKLLLDDLERAESECELLQTYVERFHDADKRAAVLEERLNKQTAFDILFTVCIGLGGAIMGVAPLFWGQGSKGPITLWIGILLVIGSAVARVVKK
jgi:hypothetical protein